jgi:signal transduction histidine kinase
MFAKYQGMSTSHTTSRLILGQSAAVPVPPVASFAPVAEDGLDESRRTRRRRQARRSTDRRASDRRRENADILLAEQTRRIAADVHDLVMQDLCFALASARALEDDPAQATVVITAAERALAGAREVLSGLARQDRKPVVQAVEACVRAAARDTPLTFESSGVAADVQPDLPTLEALVHIAREAVTNAVKHSSPDRVAVVLEHDDEWRLQVHDTGRGFDVASAGSGFGLDSMRARVRMLGGSLRVTSAVGCGTIVEVHLP